LIAEDDGDINSLITDALTKGGYECKAAFSGTEALLYIKNETFNVILLDLMLPGSLCVIIDVSEK
jgi:two-component system, OmpR family, response regulator